MILTILLIIINALLVLSLIIGLIFIFKDTNPPKLRAKFAVYLTFLFSFYLILILGVTVKLFFASKYALLPVLLLFFISPFVIGNFTNYKNLKFLTLVQITTFALSLLYVIYIFGTFRYI